MLCYNCVVFTGIIETTALIRSITPSHLVLERPSLFDDCKLGSSIAVNGCCLTVIAMDEQEFSFDFTEETWNLTAFEEKRVGQSVNLERAMIAGARVDGHMVQGHIEGTGVVVECAKGILRVRIQKEFMKNVVPKGSIAIDGVSLTVAEIDDDIIRIAVIPFTFDHTIMHDYAEGDHVNIETDILLRRS